MSQICIELIEYKPVLFKKDFISEDIGYKILNDFSTYIEIDFPNPKNKWQWRLMSLGWVGIINVNQQTTIFLNPKITTTNIFSMWEYAYRLKSFHLLKGTVNCNSIVDFYNRIALLLSKQIIQRCKKGLYKAYTDYSDRLPYICGRVDVKDSLNHPGSVFLKCDYQKITVDNEYNQILLWTLDTLRKTNEIAKSRTIVIQAYRSLLGMISLVPYTSSDCVQKYYNSLNDDYMLMHSLCRFILEFAQPNGHHGDRKTAPFLVNMSRLFELFIAECCWIENGRN